MTDTRRTPRLRFQRFSGAWVQCRLRDFGTATGGTSIESEFSEAGIYRVINIGSYSEDSVYRDQGIRAVDSDKTRDRLLNKGDLTMILNDKTSSGNIIGRVLLVEESGKYVYNQRTERIEVNTAEYDSLFLYEMLNAPHIRGRIIKQSQGNTQIYVNWSVISETEYKVPRIEEQCYIGAFFSKFDYVIALYQRKLEQIRQFKAGMLQKMFPRDGEVVPEIRFPGFVDDWEQRKLGDICEVTMGQSPDGSTYSDEPSDYILVQGNADLKDGWVSPRIWTTQKTKTAQAGDLIMSVRAPAGAMGKTAYDVVLGRGVAGIKGDEFIYQTLLKYDADGYWKKLAAGSTFESINSDAVKGAVISIPQDVEEQKKIGEYFSNLDTLITLHQRKLDKMKEYKKGLLQQMFV